MLFYVNEISPVCWLVREGHRGAHRECRGGVEGAQRGCRGGTEGCRGVQREHTGSVERAQRGHTGMQRGLHLAALATTFKEGDNRKSWILRYNLRCFTHFDDIKVSWIFLYFLIFCQILAEFYKCWHSMVVTHCIYVNAGRILPWFARKLRNIGKLDCRSWCSVDSSVIVTHCSWSLSLKSKISNNR